MLYIYIYWQCDICTFCMLVPRILLVIKHENNWERSKNRFALIWEYQTEMVEQVMCQQTNMFAWLSEVIFIRCWNGSGYSGHDSPSLSQQQKKRKLYTLLVLSSTVSWVWSALILWTKFTFLWQDSVTSARCKHIPQESGSVCEFFLSKHHWAVMEDH